VWALRPIGGWRTAEYASFNEGITCLIPGFNLRDPNYV
jgi:hypothetical protein